MDDAGGPRWLRSYYERMLSESEISLRRRDNVTHWSYVIMAAAVGTYAGFLADGSNVPSLARLGLVAGAMVVLVKFFFMSAIAYGYYQRWRHFRKQIERHWMHGKPTLDTIISEIGTYDHGRALPPTIRGIFRGQVVSGAYIPAAVLLIPLAIELYQGRGWEQCLAVLGLVVFFFVELRSYRSYDQVQPAPRGGRDLSTLRG